MSDPLPFNDPPTLSPPAPPDDLSAREAPTLTSHPGQPASPPCIQVRLFGDYELLEEIARGGMGIVYRARQKKLNRIVALKMILPAADVQRFRTEAEAVAELDHPHIVPIHEVGEQDGQHYFSMKLIDGGSLSQHLPQLAQDPNAAVRLLASVARAVHHAHQRGILHRDLKPGNILVDDQGQPHVTDFGLAKRVQGDLSQTQTGAIVGTPSYMAPEQAAAKKNLTTAVDVYSLGAILYELLCGRPPFRAETPIDTILQVLDQEPIRPRSLHPHINRDLETICLKCLEKESTRRYDSAAALADDLERWLRSEPILARPSTAWERTLKWARRKPAAAALVGVTALGALTVLGIILGFTLKLQALLNQVGEQRDLVAKQRDLAEQRRQEAEDRRHEADKERQRAVDQEEQARKRERVARLYSYAADLTLAEQAQESGNGVLLTKALQRQVPKAGQEDFRSFEWYYLWNLCHPERQVLPGFGPSVLVYSPDGSLLATADSLGGAVKVWDINTGRERWNWKIGSPPSRDIAGGSILAFSSDGQFLAIGHTSSEYPRNRPDFFVRTNAQFQVQMWDAGTGKKVSDLKMAKGDLFALAFSMDGQALIGIQRILADPNQNESGVTRKGNELPNQLWCWNLAQGRETAVALEEVPGWDLKIERAIFSPDRKTLATSGNRILREDPQVPKGRAGLVFRKQEPVVCLWDVLSGQLRKIIQAGSSPLSFGPTYVVLAFAPDSQTLAVLDRDHSIRRFRCDTGEEISIWKGVREAIGLAFRPDGQILAVANANQTVDLWNVAAGRKEATLFSSGVPAPLVYSPDGKTLAANGALWDADFRPGPRVVSLPEPGDWPISFSADGKTLLFEQEDHIALWDVETQKKRAHLKYPADEIDLTHLATVTMTLGTSSSPLGPELILALSTPFVAGPGGRFSKPKTTYWGVNTRHDRFLAVSADDRFLVSQGAGRGVTVWDLVTSKMLFSAHPAFQQNWKFYEYRCPPLFASNQKLVSGKRSWDVSSWEERVIAGILPPVLFASTAGMMASPLGQGPFLAVSSFQATRAAKFMESYGRVFGQGEMPSVNSPDGTKMITFEQGWMPCMIRVREQATGQLLWQQAFFFTIETVSFSPDGQTVALGDVDGNLWIWKPGTGQEPLRLEGHTKPVHSLCFSPDGRTLVSASADGTVKCWDPETGQERLTLRYDNWQPRQVLFTPDSQLLAVSWLDPANPSANGIVALYPAERQKAWGNDANALNLLSWAVVGKPGADTFAYRQAFLQAKEAVRLAPQDGNILNTLGVAQYRLGQYQQAMETLLRSNEINSADPTGPVPTDLAFLAMTCYRLGQTDKAQDYWKRLRSTMEKAEWAKDEDTQAIVREAESVLQGKPEGSGR